MNLLVDGQEVCRLKSGESKIVELSPGAEQIQVSHQGAISTPHTLQGLNDGDHLQIVRQDLGDSYFGDFILPLEFQRVV